MEAVIPAKSSFWSFGGAISIRTESRVVKYSGRAGIIFILPYSKYLLFLLNSDSYKKGKDHF